MTDGERRMEKRERRVMKEGARETETKLFAEPFARSPARRRRFIISRVPLLLQIHSLPRDSISRRGFRLSPTKTTAMTSGSKVSRLILPYSISNSEHNYDLNFREEVAMMSHSRCRTCRRGGAIGNALRSTIRELALLRPRGQFRATPKFQTSSGSALTREELREAEKREREK